MLIEDTAETLKYFFFSALDLDCTIGVCVPSMFAFVVVNELLVTISLVGSWTSECANQNVLLKWLRLKRISYSAQACTNREHLLQPKYVYSQRFHFTSKQTWSR